jgi:hypothetical protein
MFFSEGDDTDMMLFRILPSLVGYGFSVSRLYEERTTIFEGSAAMLGWAAWREIALPRHRIGGAGITLPVPLADRLAAHDKRKDFLATPRRPGSPRSSWQREPRHRRKHNHYLR